MATIKIVSVDKRLVTLDVTWSDGLSVSGLKVPDVPVEVFSRAQEYLYTYVSGIYSSVKAQADELAYNNPTIDPNVIKAIGHTFDDLGNIIS